MLQQTGCQGTESEERDREKKTDKTEKQTKLNSEKTVK